MNLQENIRRIIREEIKKESPLLSLLNMLFDGFDDIEYDWADYDCGLGVCCDPYAIGFTLPNSNYDVYTPYTFKLVDSNKYDDDGDYPKELSDELPEVCYEHPNINDPRFDTIILGFDETEEIKKYIGSEKKWSREFIDIINNKFGANVKHLQIAWW